MTLLDGRWILPLDIRPHPSRVGALNVDREILASSRHNPCPYMLPQQPPHRTYSPSNCLWSHCSKLFAKRCWIGIIWMPSFSVVCSCNHEPEVGNILGWVTSAPSTPPATYFNPLCTRFSPIPPFQSPCTMLFVRLLPCIWPVDHFRPAFLQYI